METKYKYEPNSELDLTSKTFTPVLYSLKDNISVNLFNGTIVQFTPQEDITALELSKVVIMLAQLDDANRGYINVDFNSYIKKHYLSRHFNIMTPNS